MQFSVNHPIIFVIVGIVIAIVLAQSVFFLVKAVRRAKELGVESSTVKKTISSASPLLLRCWWALWPFLKVWVSPCPGSVSR